MAPTNSNWPREPLTATQEARSWFTRWLVCWLVAVLAVIVVPEVADYSGPEVIAFVKDAARVAAQGAVFGTIAFVIWRAAS